MLCTMMRRQRARPPIGPAPALVAATLAVVLLAGSSGARAEVCDDDGLLHPAAASIISVMAAHLGSMPAAEAAADVRSAAHFAQQALMRPRHAERLDHRAKAHYGRILAGLDQAKRAQLAADFQRLGWLDAVAAPRQAVDYVLINGSTVPSMRARVMAVATALQAGALRLAPTAHIVVLDGQRPLFPAETAQVLRQTAPYESEPGWRAPSPLPTDERDAAEMVWQQLKLPRALRAMQPIFVHAEARAGAPRAQTRDCVALWLARHRPASSVVLVVSDQPYVEYQRRVTQNLLAQHGAHGLCVTAMGPAATRLHGMGEEERLGVLLDNLANTLARAEEGLDLGVSSLHGCRAPTTGG